VNGENYAGNIIVNLASLPGFLRGPILKRRMQEFFGMSEQEKNEVIHNALDAGPTIPFPNFARLLQTWLEVICTLSKEEREEIFSRYITKAAHDPGRLIGFNMDGIMEVYHMLKEDEIQTIQETIAGIVSRLGPKEKRIIQMIIPDEAAMRFGI